MLRSLTHASPHVNADSLGINVTDQSVVTIEDLGDLFECGSFGLDVEEVYEDELECDPALFSMISFANVDEGSTCWHLRCR